MTAGAFPAGPTTRSSRTSSRIERRVGSNHGGVYGTRGPIHVEELRTPNPATAAFLQACGELGLTRLAELNGPSNEGYSQTPVTQNRGRRWSSADAYLRPAAKRPNLTVLTSSHVRGILVADGRAIGVKYGDGTVVRARREVILSAGAIGSPHLLMLSGIGAADELRADGVEPVHELPQVGKNLQDHLASGIFLHCPRSITLAGAESVGNLLRFLVGRRGMLTSNVGEAVAFIRTSPDEPAPDIELIFAPGPFINHGLTPPPGHGLTIAAILLQPESRGRISLDGGEVVIDPGYLTAEADLRRLVAGLKKAGELFETAALGPLAGPPMDPYWGARTDEELARWIRERSETLYHPVGTCRMGQDADSVVDPDLKVRGIDALRVVDASVMPVINRGHTHAPTVMIAEKAADLIGYGRRVTGDDRAGAVASAVRRRCHRAAGAVPVRVGRVRAAVSGTGRRGGGLPFAGLQGGTCSRHRAPPCPTGLKGSAISSWSGWLKIRRRDSVSRMRFQRRLV